MGYKFQEDAGKRKIDTKPMGPAQFMTNPEDHTSEMSYAGSSYARDSQNQKSKKGYKKD